MTSSGVFMLWFNHSCQFIFRAVKGFYFERGWRTRLSSTLQVNHNPFIFLCDNLLVVQVCRDVTMVLRSAGRAGWFLL